VAAHLVFVTSPQPIMSAYRKIRYQEPTDTVDSANFFPAQ
jgi:hypothetical protein